MELAYAGKWKTKASMFKRTAAMHWNTSIVKPHRSQVFYLLLQIAHQLFQLVQHGSLFRRAFPAGVGSAKNLAFRLLEA